MSIHQVCDYIIYQLQDSNANCSHLKLQKLLYYTQAWHLAIHGDVFFQGKFQAWVHGPVSRTIYDRFAEKSLYASLTKADCKSGFEPTQLTKPQLDHIRQVFDSYAHLTGYDLEQLTHQEKPWLEARGNLHPAARCETEISETTMQTFYAQRLV